MSRSLSRSPIPGWAIVLACLIGSGVTFWIGFSAPERSGDFNEFFSAARLAGSGHMFDYDRIRELELENGTNAIPFGRLPFYAVVLKPLTLLPYRAARLVWLAINLSALVLFAWLWPIGRRCDAFMILCWSCPAAILLSTGQDSGLFLAAAAIGLRLLESKRDFAAGLVFSLCAAKFHLALGIPAFLIARRRWGAVAGGLAGALAQLAVSFAVEGGEWPSHLLQLAKISDFSPSPAKMPNLLGLTHWLPSSATAEVILAMLALGAVWIVARRSALCVGATAAIAAGLLASHHAYVYDGVLLLPAILLALRSSAPNVLRYWALLVSIPIPYLFLMQEQAPALAQIAINGFSLWLLGWMAAQALAAAGWPPRARAASFAEEGS